jgi:hypothetical protein
MLPALLFLTAALGAPVRAQGQQDRLYFYEDVLTPFFARDDAAGVYRARRPGASAASFPIAKSPDAFRVFVIGGSIAQRYMSEHDHLGESLREALPTRRVEVIGCGMNGYDSEREALIVAEVLDDQPDLIVLMTGHNERLGASTRRPPLAERLAAGLDRLRGMLADAGVPPDGPPQMDRREAAARRDRAFAENLDGMLRRAAARGVPVMVAIPPLNYRDGVGGMPAPWTPDFAAGWVRWRRGDDAGALAAWRRALEGLKGPRGDDPESGRPVERFWTARAEERAGDPAAAVRDYARAVDDDAVMGGRCAGACPGIIRAAAARDGALVADLDAAFRAADAPRAPGFDMFEDDVHWLHADDRYATAAFLDALRSAPAFRGLPWDEGRLAALRRRWSQPRAAVERQEDLAVLRRGLQEAARPDGRFSWKATVYLGESLRRHPSWFDHPDWLIRTAELGSGLLGWAWGMPRLRVARAPFFWHLGEARAERGDARGALADFARARALDPGLKRVLLQQAIEQELSGDAAAARASLADAARDPELRPEAAALASGLGLK